MTTSDRNAADRGLHDGDVALLEELRGVFEVVDPVPAVVVELGRAAYGLRRLDEDLMEIAALAPELSEVRGPATSRMHMFELGEVSLDVEVLAEGVHCWVTGILEDPNGSGDVTVTVETAGGSTASTLTEPDGRFTAAKLPVGLMRLAIARPDGRAMRTPWIDPA